MSTKEKMIAIGGTMKAVGDTGLIEGYGVAFTSPDERDLHGQYFTKDTNFHREIDEIVGIPILYQHGFDDRIKRRILGYVTKAAIDDRGVWIQAQLDLHKDYVQDVYELSKRGVLSFSSGADAPYVTASQEGHLDDWPFVEFSETPTPAEPRKTVISAKSYAELIKGDTGHEDQDAGATADRHSQSLSNTPITKAMSMKEKILQMLAAIIEMLNGETAMDAGEQTDVMRAMEDEVKVLPEEEQKALESDEDTAAKTAAIDKLILKASKSRADRKLKQQTSLKGRYDQLKKTTVGESVTDRVGVPTKNVQLSVSEERLYADMSAIDMALALKMREATLRGIPYDPQFIFGKRTEGFMKTLAHKMNDYVHQDKSVTGRHMNAMKSVMPWKSGELDASTVVGQGLEWVGEIFDADLWLKPRLERYLYDELVSKGMWVRTIPQGADTINIPTEGADPRWFTAPQATGVDATGKPETTAKFTPIGTGTVPLSAPELVCATSVTYILEEDSIVAIAPEVNRQINLSFLEMRDSLIMNGDIVRTNAANVNFIDGTPPGGLESPSYLAFDGLRKMALVTYTDQARFGGALEYADFSATIFLLPYRVRSRVKNIVLIISPNVEEWGLLLPENATRDVRGDEFTNQTGRLPLTYGQMPYTTDLLPLTGVAGKEYQLVANLGNNVYGTIMAAHAPYLAFGNKRQITIESARNMYSGTIDWVARVRMGMVARGADGVGLTYGLSQN